ncbi:FAD-dependent oxidoreductase [Heyndrickxia oleronia]|uniref:FAD-dependent oxidoreductase n=1 Tax=Heyndrickxia oleronia TaxID=38875 RepID=UPI0021B2AFFC|nr:FAD-dependent oxidoreductase [Heyndrickxia oleronia]
MKNKKLWITTGFSLFILIFIFVATQLIQHKNNSQQNNSLSYQQPKLKKTYDVIVVGGEPEGVAAAVAAARNGSKTLLIEKRDGLGGLFTYGMLNFLDIGKDMNNEPVNAGIFKEWHNLVGNQSAFDIEDAKAAFMKLVKNEPNLTLALETDLVSVIKDGNKLTGLKIKDYENKEKEIHAQRFIDSTKDADLAVMAGAPYFTGGEDIGFKNRKMSVTLMIHLKDVDWEGIKRASQRMAYLAVEQSTIIQHGDIVISIQLINHQMHKLDFVD